VPARRRLTSSRLRKRFWEGIWQSPAAAAVHLFARGADGPLGDVRALALSAFEACLVRARDQSDLSRPGGALWYGDPANTGAPAMRQGSVWKLGVTLLSQGQV